LEKWLKSLALHARYAHLDGDSYWKVQPWPEHQRPSRWILDLAAQKTAALKAQLEARIAQGDSRFSDSLELMTFLANLIGSEHIERFIPLADADQERNLEAPVAAPRVEPPVQPSTAPGAEGAGTAARGKTSAGAQSSTGTTSVTREMPKFVAAKRATQKPGAARGAPDSPTATREMPQLASAKRRAPPPVSTPQVARTERRHAETALAPRTAAKQSAKIAPPSAGESAREQVIADAARLVQWGRKWYELAELIARMADRPPLSEVRRILKDNKTAIEKKAGGG
jgi:hypothetical protein